MHARADPQGGGAFMRDDPDPEIKQLCLSSQPQYFGSHLLRGFTCFDPSTPFNATTPLGETVVKGLEQGGHPYPPQIHVRKSLWKLDLRGRGVVPHPRRTSKTVSEVLRGAGPEEVREGRGSKKNNTNHSECRAESCSFHSLVAGRDCSNRPRIGLDRRGDRMVRGKGLRCCDAGRGNTDGGGGGHSDSGHSTRRCRVESVGLLNFLLLLF